MHIGILAVQGAFIEHQQLMERLGCDCIQFRKKEDICPVDGLIFPGGESTVQGKLLHELDMFDTIQSMIKSGTPVLATCAGLILLAEHLSNDSNVYLGTLPVTVKRNAYGKQLGSFTAGSTFADLGNFEMTFIRAPYIESAAEDVQVLSTFDGKITGVKYQNQIGITFHPELGTDTRIHQYFLNQIKKT